MASTGYFNYFNRTLYSFSEGLRDPAVVGNILERSKFLKEVTENVTFFYNYSIQEEDTPEIIASKLYKDPYRAWIVLLFNQIRDPYYQFPLNRVMLERYIVNKYNQTVAQSQTTIHNYEQETISTYILNGIPKITSNTVTTIDEYQIDPDTNAVTARGDLPTIADTYYDQSSVNSPTFTDTGYVNIVNRLWAISNYTYELRLNEQRRNIYLLDKKYVPQIEKEFKMLMRNSRYG